MNKDTEEKINTLSVLEQNLQQLSSQKRSFQNQLIELDSAIDELSSSETSYRIIGNIMVKTDKASLKEELESKKQVIDVRIKAIEKQEKSIKDRNKSLQEEIMKEMESQDDAKESSSKGD